MRLKKVITGFCIAASMGLVACNDMYVPDLPQQQKSRISFYLSGNRFGSRAGSDDMLPQVTEVPMGDDVSCSVSVQPRVSSRAAAVNDTESMQQFGVYAHRTMVEGGYSFYIKDQKVGVDDSGNCSMSVDYDWPEDKSVLQFHAYYPYHSSNMTLPEAAGSSFSFQYQVPQDMALQEDLMIASSTAFYGDAYTSVPLQFSHICSQVTVRLDEGLEDFAIQSVSFVGVQHKGTYYYTDGWVLDDEVISMGGLAKDATANGFTFMMLPQHTSVDAQLHVTIHNHISGTDQTYFMHLGQQWLQGYKMTYLVSLTPQFNLKFVSEAEPQDAHYVIYPIAIHAEEVAVGWTVESDQSWATVTSSLTDLQKLGYWIEDDKGTVTVAGKQTTEDIPLYVFLTENVGDAPRTATLKLYPTGYPNAARSFTITQQPVQRSGGIGFECYETDFGAERLSADDAFFQYGFYWNRYVSYVSSDFFYRLIIHWSAQDAINDNDASSYVTSTYKFLNKTTVVIDYAKLNDLGNNAEDTDTGFDNTWNLYNFRGIGNISAIETVFDSWGINKTFTGDEIDKVQNFAAKVALMKNKFTKTVKTESSGGTTISYDVPVISYDDIVWYLPVTAEYAAMSSSNFPLSGTYWTSEAVKDNVRAIKYTIGDNAGTQELRTEPLRIRCARK